MADVDRLAEIMDDYAFGKQPERADAIQKLNDYIDSQRQEERDEIVKPIVDMFDNIGKNKLWHSYVVNLLRAKWPILYKYLMRLRERYIEDAKGGNNEED